MNPKLKTVIYILALVAIIGTVAVLASTPWTQNISWSEAPEPEFSVTASQTIDYGQLAFPVTKIETYTVINTGAVPVTVHTSAVATGAGVNWNKDSATIPVGGSTTFQLTLTITAVGSCQVTIS